MSAGEGEAGVRLDESERPHLTRSGRRLVAQIDVPSFRNLAGEREQA
jgi:hypothetical protein